MVIEDDPDIIEAITLSLRMAWPQVNVIPARYGQEGVDLARAEGPDVILLDLVLPDKDGFHVLAEIRTFSPVAVIIITIRADELDRVRGLELGADDYIVKPFSHMELLARLRTVLRRSKAIDTGLPRSFEHGELTVNFETQEVKLHGEEVNLTPIEYKLLVALAANAGQTMSQKLLAEKVWGEDYPSDPNVIKVHMHHLRRKIGDNPKNPHTIITVPGKGYRFNVSSHMPASRTYG